MGLQGSSLEITGTGSNATDLKRAFFFHFPSELQDKRECFVLLFMVPFRHWKHERWTLLAIMCIWSLTLPVCEH